MSTTTDRIDLSLEEKRALLAQLLQEKATKSNTFPLSFAQQRLWFLAQMEPESHVYNVPEAIRMSGGLNVEALQQTLAQIVARHESLRTTFTMMDGDPVQVIAPTLRVELPLVDLTGLPESERETEARRLALKEAQRSFDLERGPLMRASLLGLGTADHVLLLNMHHIVSDAWSMGVFMRELTTLYEAFSQGKPSPLAELPIQYADYAVWQREWLEGEVLEEQLAYWRQHMAGAPTILELPTDRPRPAMQSNRGAFVSLGLSKNLGEGLKALSHREGVTLFMTLLAAFQTLLARYTRQEEIVVGSPIAGRTRAETESLIGLFINTLILRTDLAGDPTFRELLGRVREVALGAYAHQDVPFEKLVEELRPERSLSHSPLFQVMFTLQNAPRQNLELSGLALRPLRFEHDIAKFDLLLAMVEGDQGLRGALEYSTDLFDEVTIKRMLGHFQVLLEGIVADPDQRLSELPLLSEAERHQLVLEWNAPQTDYPKDLAIHELFEAQVEQRPNAVAIVFEDQQFTYCELNRRANQLAHHLQRLGVGPEIRVGIMMDRSIEMVVGLLGILKAGGAYVPLDPAYPLERLAFMLEDARLPVMLIQASLRTELPEHRAKVISLDTDWATIARESVENPNNTAAADNLAYVIYTSGSTGRPKGVLVTHHNVVRLFKATEAWFNFDEHDVWTLFHSYAFDFSVWELWGALAYGGRLVVVPYAVSRSPEAFYDLLGREGVTVLNQTPPAFRQLIQAEAGANAADKLALRYVIFGGEALELESLRPWFERHGDDWPQLVNMYGITETTVHATYRPLTMEDVESTAGSVIGRHIPDLQVYALDQHLQPVPIGVPGEIYIGGAGVARGYLNRAELTDERFVADPFSNKAEGRLYKSGDLAKYLPGGDMEYLGRIDQQVKIRGFRIELGEIEAALLQHPAIEQVVVVAREDVPGEKRLVAYVVAHEGPAPTVSELVSRMKGKVPQHLMADADVKKAPMPDVSELRGFLSDKLPDYMVPSAFVMLYELPLTPNGKVDQRALPVPDQARPELERAYLAPRDTLELQLTKIWEKVLGVEPIGIKDNFFDLGGHSLLAVRLFAQIETSFGRSLPLATLFQAPTIEQLGDILRQQGWTSQWSSLVPIQPGGSKPPFYCMHAGGGEVFFYRDLAHRLGPDQPFYGLQIRTLNGVQMPHITIEEMAAHYIEEIRTLQPEGPYYLGGASSGGTVAFEMAHQLLAQGQKVALVAMFDTNGPNYPKFLPGVTARHHKVNFLKQRIEHHLGSLHLLEPHDRLAYLVLKAKKVPKIIEQNIKNKYRKIAPRFYQATGRPLPPALTKSHNAILKAYIDYVPQVYPGRVTLFRAKTQLVGVYPDPTLGWDGIAAEGLEIHEIPGYHGAMMAEPRVRYLAEKLKNCLAIARAAESTERV